MKENEGKKMQPREELFTPQEKSLEQDVIWMTEALHQAQKAYDKQEVPVGAVLVKNNQIISSAYNTKESSLRPTAHAEIKALEMAAGKLSSWRLLDCELYVTLSPCLMCWGAILESRISRVIYGALEPEMQEKEKLFFDRSFHIQDGSTKFRHGSLEVLVTQGVLEKPCSEILSLFFQEKRRENKSARKDG